MQYCWRGLVLAPINLSAGLFDYVN